MAKLNLALQGGGAHGAYTWGVLTRLLEEEDLEIEAISGTSAGALNAALLVNGYHKGGRQGAIDSLEKFWYEVSFQGAVFNPVQSRPNPSLAKKNWNLDWSLSYNYYDILSHILSPYQLNPLNLNPLRWILEKTLEPDILQDCQSIKLFITATSVRSGQPRVFNTNEITNDVLLASACIPFLFQAVVIDDEPYWDGGYMGNPSLWPLIYKTQSADILLVQINPLYRQETPDNAHEIINRLNEITFNSSLISEMRAINFVSRLIKENRLDSTTYKDMHIHMITGDGQMADYNASSKMNSNWQFFQKLHSIGYQAADQWLQTNKQDIGKKSTIDIQEVFLKRM